MDKYLLTLLVLLCGCADLPRKPGPVWEKPGATTKNLESDRSYCLFEVEKATQLPDPQLRNVFVQEYDRAERRRALMTSCMRSRGYAQR